MLAPIIAGGVADAMSLCFEASPVNGPQSALPATAMSGQNGGSSPTSERQVAQDGILLTEAQIAALEKAKADKEFSRPSSTDRKTPITAAEILNDRVVPFYGSAHINQE